jgi:hypothetical protein
MMLVDNGRRQWYGLVVMISSLAAPAAQGSPPHLVQLVSFLQSPRIDKMLLNLCAIRDPLENINKVFEFTLRKQLQVRN